MSQVKAANGNGKAKKSPNWFQGKAKPNGSPTPRLNGGWISPGGQGSRSTKPDWSKALGFKPDLVLIGTSPIEYSHWQKEFRLDALALGVWDMIASPDVTTQTLSIAINAGGGPLPMAAIMGSLVEDVFSRLVPCQANATTVRQYKDTHLDDLHLMYQNRIWRLEENPNLSNNQKIGIFVSESEIGCFFERVFLV
jgi:hypothetical protein